MDTDGVNQDLIGATSIHILRDAGNHLEGVISAVGADGFTVTWSLTGACSVEVLVLCLP